MLKFKVFILRVGELILKLGLANIASSIYWILSILEQLHNVGIFNGQSYILEMFWQFPT